MLLVLRIVYLNNKTYLSNTKSIVLNYFEFIIVFINVVIF